MIWFRSISWVEIAMIAAFVLFYGFYLARMIRISRVLKSSMSAVFLKLGLRTSLFALLLIAYLGPSFGEAKREVQSVGKDIMICVDLSKSMDAFDIQPSRLEKIKFEMKKLVEAFSSDRLGIIIFSSEAFMQCPLTYDQNALNLFIETMNTSLVPGSGTDFGPPLRMAMQKLEDPQAATHDTKSKIILLISDGEDFGDDTGEIAKEIADKDIKLFTLGIGTEHGSQIYAGRSLKTDRNGNPVISKLNPESLKKVANQTGGKYFEINESGNDVTRLINTIRKIEGQIRESRLVDVSANRYFYFLLVAIILLAVDVLLSVRTVTI